MTRLAGTCPEVKLMGGKAGDGLLRDVHQCDKILQLCSFCRKPTMTDFTPCSGRWIPL